MKQISNKEYEKYQQYQTDKLHGRILTPDGLRIICAGLDNDPEKILDAQALYPDASLADLYDERTMPPELRTAHQRNDRAVMEAYGMRAGETTESACVAELMRRYQALTEKQQ